MSNPFDDLDNALAEDDPQPSTETDSESDGKEGSAGDERNAQNGGNAENAENAENAGNAGGVGGARNDLTSGDGAGKAVKEGNSMNDMNAVRESGVGDASNQSGSGKAQNVKKDWNARSVYLPDGVDGDLTTAFKRLDFELSQAGYNFSLKKTRHFYPLVIQLGLERLGGMELNEVMERME